MGVPFLLTISFLLHIVTLAAIYFLFKQLSAKERSSNQQSDDFIALMDTYLEEIKMENDKLEEQLRQQQSYPSSKLRSEHQKKKETQETLKQSPTDTINFDQVVDQAEMSLEAKILQLHREGKKIDEIAKELDCGKTEAELVIKFHAK